MSNKGFTLVEMSLVLLVVSILLMGFTAPLATFKEVNSVRNTREAEREAVEALQGYAIANGRLPCPDTSGDGQEDCTGAAVQIGRCPYATLAITCEDGWGQLLVYAVDGNFTSTFTMQNGVGADVSAAATAAGKPASTGMIEVKPSAALDTSVPPWLDLVAPFDAPDTEPYDRRMFAPAVFLSSGKSWAQGARSPDETENTDGDGVFVFHEYAPDSNAASYDDIVIWLNWNILMHRMVMAGKLP